MAKKRVHVMNTSFRDGFQSVVGARVFTKDFLPALSAAQEAGFTHFEAGGGARYQVPYLYCNEDAFEMMDTFRATVGPEANLQTLARGVNVVGLDSQSSDIIKMHATLFKKHGMTTIRNFDALNDVRNLIYSGQCIAEAGLNHEVVVTIMELPPGCSGAHTPEFYLEVLRNILDHEVPYASVCFKDASGTAVPSKIYETIKGARKMLPEGTHIRVHTHQTAGIAIMQYKAALDAGVDGIDLAMAPMSGGTSQPDVITMWHALRGTEYDLGLDIDKVLEAEAVFKDCMKDYFLPPEAQRVEPVIPYSPMPGGALTANTQMMRDNGMLDKFPEVITAMSEVVRRGGFGTSVTPVSQLYFQQAFNNVVFGPWKRMAEGYGKMVLGYFGKTPAPPDPEIVNLASEQLGLEPTTEDPRAINDRDSSKGIDAANARLEAAGLPITEENTFIAATCADKGIAFLKGDGPIAVRKNQPQQAAAPTAAQNTGAYEVKVAGQLYQIEIDGDEAIINGERISFSVGAAEASATTPASGGSGAKVEVRSDLPGKILSIQVKQGAQVKAGDVLLMMEALKMEIEVKAPQDGAVANIAVQPQQQVANGDLLVALS